MEGFVSAHITLKEATHTDTHLPNDPNDQEFINMVFVAGRIFEPLREFFGKPIAVTSFFRTKEVNKKIGGAKNSQHTLGQAMDIDGEVIGGIQNEDIFNYIYKYLEYDQLIGEDLDDFGSPGWVHVSAKQGGGNRSEALVMIKEKGKVKYYPYNGSLKKSDYK